jgi:hypothetical protein
MPGEWRKQILVFSPSITQTKAFLFPRSDSGPFRPSYETYLAYHENDASVTSPIYFEIIDFIAAGTRPQSVADFRASPEAQQRRADLIESQRAGTLSPEEKAEVDHFMELEHNRQDLREAMSPLSRKTPAKNFHLPSCDPKVYLR